MGSRFPSLRAFSDKHLPRRDSRRGGCQHHCTIITLDAPRTAFAFRRSLSHSSLEAFGVLTARNDCTENTSTSLGSTDSITRTHLLDRRGPREIEMIELTSRRPRYMQHQSAPTYPVFFSTSLSLSLTRSTMANSLSPLDSFLF